MKNLDYLETIKSFSQQSELFDTEDLKNIVPEDKFNKFFEKTFDEYDFFTKSKVGIQQFVNLLAHCVMDLDKDKQVEFVYNKISKEQNIESLKCYYLYKIQQIDINDSEQCIQEMEKYLSLSKNIGKGFITSDFSNFIHRFEIEEYERLFSEEYEILLEANELCN